MWRIHLEPAAVIGAANDAAPLRPLSTCGYDVAHLASEAMLLGAGSVVGRYRIIREIGRGGMASVHEAMAQDGSRVALKILLPEMAKIAVVAERFSREARILETLQHPHVTRILEVGTLPDGTQFHATELLHGEDMKARIARGPLPIGVAVRYVIEACLGLSAAHARGVIHRDLKPANLFISRTPEGETVKLLDFGVARAEGMTALTQTHDALGSPYYLAPEQLSKAKNAGPEADIWGLGVVLFEAIAGVAPFEGDNLPDLCTAILRAPTPSPRDRRPECPEALAAVVRRCLEKDPKNRYLSADELVAALAPFDAGPVVRTAGVTALALEEEPLSGHTKIIPEGFRAQRRSAVQTMPVPPREPPRRWPVVVVATILAVAAGGAALVVVRPWKRPPRAVTVRVTTEPTGAFVSIDYGPRMTSPTAAAVPADGIPHVVSVWKDGYVPEKRSVSPTTDTDLDIALTPAQ